METAHKFLLGVLVFLLCFPLLCFCQSPELHFERISTIDGLSDNNVVSIALDAKGFMWFGTSDGLNRYDGKHFKIYRHNSNDSFSISSNNVIGVLAAKDGKIWASTDDGLNCLDPITDKFKRYFHDPKNPSSLSSNFCARIFQDSAGIIWIATSVGLTELNPVTEKIITYQNNPSDTLSISPNRTFTFLADKQNNFWIGTDHGLNLLDRGTSKFQRFLSKNPFSNWNDCIVYSISEANENNLWLTILGQGLINYNIKSKKYIQYLERPEVAHRGDHNILYDNEQCDLDTNLIYIASNERDFSIFNKSTGKFTSYMHRGSNDYPESVGVLFNDHKGILWVGAKNGVYKLDIRKSLFNSIVIPPNYCKDCLSFITALCQSRFDKSGNNLWIGTWTCGLFKVNIANNTFTLISKGLKIPNHENYAAVTEIMQDNTGNLWIGLENGLLQMDSSGNLIHHFMNKKNDSLSIPGNMVYDIYEDEQERLWIATKQGLSLFNRTKNEFINYPVTLSFSKETYSGKIDQNKIEKIIKGPPGKLILDEDEKQLLLFDTKTFSYSLYFNKKNPLEDIRQIKDILYERDSILWCSTNKGLFRIVKKVSGDSVKMFTTADGLSFDDIGGLGTDNCNNLWIHTRKGLTKFNEQTGIFKAFYKEDGLTEDQPVDGILINGLNNMMFFGFGTNSATGGINYFNPCNWKFDSIPAPVSITGFKIFNREADLIKDISSLKKINLSYKDRMITFEFAELNYIHSARNQYKYKLEGFDNDWIQAGNETEATYTNLDGGNYTFHVKAANDIGVWNEKGASIAIYVRPVFYETWWFYMLCAIAITGLLYIAYKIRINQIKRVYAIRTGISRDLHDDIGSRLSSISIISQLADDKKDDPNFNVSKFYEQVKQGSKEAMDLMNDIVWSVNPKNDKLSDMLIRMREYAADILEAKNINFQIDVSTSLHNLNLRMVIRKDFYLIYKEAINNLAKYSCCSSVKISILKEHEKLLLFIEDNGKGFDLKNIKRGNGLNNMQNRAANIRGRLTIHSKIGHGTSIALEVPVA